jgi:hypothetical protein
MPRKRNRGSGEPQASPEPDPQSWLGRLKAQDFGTPFQETRRAWERLSATLQDHRRVWEGFSATLQHVRRAWEERAADPALEPLRRWLEQQRQQLEEARERRRQKKRTRPRIEFPHFPQAYAQLEVERRTNPSLQKSPKAEAGFVMKALDQLGDTVKDPQHERTIMRRIKEADEQARLREVL